MKQIMEIVFITLVLMILNSCDDIVNSDENILKTEIKYKYTKEDQENSVLLPLKVGNKWYYNVYEYDQAGFIKTLYVDSIEVIKEIVIKNEKWFEIYFPALSRKNLLISNTDIGLWVKCEDCSNKSFRLASYPVNSGLFASGYTDIGELPILKSEYMDLLLKLVITKKIQYEKIDVPLGNYDCIKYTSHFESDSSIINQYPFMNEYYSINKGLVKFEQFQLLSDQISKVFVLRDKPINNENVDCTESLKVNVGDIKNLLIHTEKIILKNNDLPRVIIRNVNIESESQNGLITISSLFNDSLPLALPQGDSTEMEISIKPSALGSFHSIIKVIDDNGCLYEITLEGNSVRM